MHRSPVRKFAKASEGVGHRHKLPKLVEESNNLISLSIPIQGHGQARRMPVTRNAPFSLAFSAIRKENYQYVFRGKVMKYLSDHKSPDYPAAANYLRKGIEELLNKKCPHFAIRNDNCELIESYKLSSLINSVIDFFRQIIAHRESPASIIGTLTELKTHLSTLIHPLSHYSVHTPIYKNELLEVVNLYHSMDRSLSTYNYEEDIAVFIEKGHKVEVGIEGVSGWKRKYSFKLTQHLYLIPGEPSSVLSLCGVQICHMQGLDSKGKIEYESSPSSNSRIYKQMQYRSIESAYESLVGHIRDHEQKDDIITSNYLASTKFTDVDNKTVTLQDMIKDRSR